MRGPYLIQVSGRWRWRSSSSRGSVTAVAAAAAAASCALRTAQATCARAACPPDGRMQGRERTWPSWPPCEGRGKEEGSQLISNLQPCLVLSTTQSSCAEAVRRRRYTHGKGILLYSFRMPVNNLKGRTLVRYLTSSKIFVKRSEMSGSPPELRLRIKASTNRSVES
jgi:hypothetical protein